MTTHPTVHQNAVSDDDEYWPDFEEPFYEFLVAQRDRATEEEFRKTCEKGTPEYGLLALAIGEWAARMNYPDNPPEWAIAECLKLYQRSQIIPHPIVQKKLGPCASESDGHLLERVADFIKDIDLHPVTLKWGQSVSVRSAIRRALAEARQPENEANIRRLQRLWAKDRDHLSGMSGRMRNVLLTFPRRTVEHFRKALSNLRYSGVERRPIESLFIFRL